MTTQKQFETEQTLCELYYNPVMGFSSAQKLFEKAKEEGLDVSLVQVRNWLKAQETYTRFKTAPKKFTRRQTFSPSMGDQLQMDLVEMIKYEEENDHYPYILTGMDVFSRYVFALPLRRKHKEFTVNVVKLLLEQFKERFGDYPRYVQSDDGGEFANTQVEPYLKGLSITYFSTRLTSFNRTLKDRMWRYFDHEGHRKWLDVLPHRVENVNTSVNRTIGIAPVDVNKENEPLIRTKLYGEPHDITNKFHLGDKVRVAKYTTPIRVLEKGPFSRGFKSNFTKEVYTIGKVWYGVPSLYSLKDEDGTTRFGRCYGNELSAVL